MITQKQTYTAVFHVVCWIVVALPAVFFIPQHIQQTTEMYLLRLCMPLSLCIIFYLNYLWLVPRYITQRQFKIYICINVALMVMFAFSMEWLSETLRELENSGAKMFPLPPPDKPRDEFPIPFGVIKNVFPFILSVALATSLRLAMRWEEAENARREMEIQKTEAELSNLRNQINPHFLLNTLNNIYALISFDSAKAQKAVLSLSAMLRQMLYGARNNSVSLKEEVEFIGNYVELMRLRLNKNVRIDFNVENHSGLEPKIAPLIFISLVENAFKHGVSPTGNSFISIHIASYNDRIECEIRNSNFPKSGSDKSGHGIGLEQVAKRLDLAYAGKYKWEKGTDDKKEVYYSKIIIYDTEMCDNRR